MDQLLHEAYCDRCATREWMRVWVGGHWQHVRTDGKKNLTPQWKGFIST